MFVLQVMIKYFSTIGKAKPKIMTFLNSPCPFQVNLTILPKTQGDGPVYVVESQSHTETINNCIYKPKLFSKSDYSRQFQVQF